MPHHHVAPATPRPSATATDPSKKSLGLWRATQAGVDFALDRLRVPRRLWVFDNQLVSGEASEALWSIRDALRERFDYAALLASVAPKSPELTGGNR